MSDGNGHWARPGGEESSTDRGAAVDEGAAPPPPPPPPPTGQVPPPPPSAAAPQHRVGLVPLYPMGVGEILDTSFRLLRACALPAGLIVLLLMGPVRILSSLAFTSPFEMFNQQPTPTEIDPAMFGLAMLGSLLSLVVAPLAMASLTWLGAHADETSRPDWRVALRHGGRRYWATLGAFMLLGLVGLVALVAVIVVVALAAAVGAVLAVLLGFTLGPAVLVLVVGLTALGYLTVPCIVVEQLGPIQGLRRAGRLFRARFWPTLGISLLVGLVFSLLGAAVSSAISVPAFLGIPGSWAFVAVGGILASLVQMPLGAYAALAIHVDQRIRTEGYDVAVLVSELRR